MEVLQRSRAFARIERAVEDEAVRVRLRDDGVLLGGVEALDIELLEVGRLDDRHVHRPVDEEVATIVSASYFSNFSLGQTSCSGLSALW